jgi:hypothetical protein
VNVLTKKGTSAAFLFRAASFNKAETRHALMSLVSGIVKWCPLFVLRCRRQRSNADLTLSGVYCVVTCRDASGSPGGCRTYAKGRFKVLGSSAPCVLTRDHLADRSPAPWPPQGLKSGQAVENDSSRRGPVLKVPAHDAFTPLEGIMAASADSLARMRVYNAV